MYDKICFSIVLCFVIIFLFLELIKPGTHLKGISKFIRHEVVEYRINTRRYVVENSGRIGQVVINGE